MTIFDHVRLASSLFKLDVDGLRRGYYSDKYFENIVQVLRGAEDLCAKRHGDAEHGKEEERKMFCD